MLSYSGCTTGQSLEISASVWRIRYPVHQMVQETATNDESILGQVPNVPVEKRPMKIANNGYHRFKTVPEQQFQQDNWNLRWEPPETEGVTF